MSKGNDAGIENRYAGRGQLPLPADIAKQEQAVIDWLSRLTAHYTRMTGTAGLGRARTQEHVARLLYFATGSQFEVRQVIPPPTHPRQPHNRQGRH